MKKNKEKKEKKKMSKVELVFDIISVVFLVGFSIFYLTRAIIWKKEFTPKESPTGQKTEFLVNKVINKGTVTEGDGLYQEDTKFVFKGKEVNNYVKYSNMLFRIVKINSDKSMELITDEPINFMKIAEEMKDYKGSDIDTYLNGYFYNLIDNEYLQKAIVCLDKTTDVAKITCNDKYAPFVKLLNISDYLNSKVENVSFLDTTNNAWLYNSNDEKYWLMNSGNLLVDAPDNLYEIYPVITVSQKISFTEGEGTLEKPYVVETDKLFGTYVKLGEDMYQVYEEDDETISLVLNSLINDGKTKQAFSKVENEFSLEANGVGKYLNTTYYDSLSYKDYLLDKEYYVGSYDDGIDKMEEVKVTSKVGLLNATNVIFNLELSNYYLNTPTGNSSVYMINNKFIKHSKNIIEKAIRPTIKISKKDLKGKGTLEDPYTKEV